MKNKDIAGELRIVAAVLERWPDGSLPDIEKDILLEKLRTVYGYVKLQAEHCGCPVNESSAKVETEVAVRTEAVIGQKEVVSGQDEDAPQAGPAAISEVAAAVQETVQPEADYPLEITPNPLTAESPQEDVSCIVRSDDEQQEIRENILFDEGEIPVRQKLDRRAILSLYGDDPQPVKKVEVPAPAPVAEPVFVPEPAEVTPAQVVVEEPVRSVDDIPVVVPQDQEPTPVLGDVLGNGGQTVSDMYAGNAEKADVASVVGSGRVSSLRGAIGINDKFLLIRNLFDGNAEIYESVMTTLDGFDDLDDALIYIHENFHWNPDSEAVKMLMDLLTRKLA